MNRIQAEPLAALGSCMKPRRAVSAGILLVLVLLAFFCHSTEDELDLTRRFIVESVTAGRCKTLSPTGAVVVSAADDSGLTLLQDGSSMRMAWNQLKPLEIYCLARGLLIAGQVDEHILIARLALKLNAGAEMDKPLERLEYEAPNDVARIEAIRALLKPAAPPVQTNEAPVKSAFEKTPAFNMPLLFDTPEADAILASVQVLPPDHPFSQEVAALPLHPNSAKIIAKIGAETILWPEQDMNYVVVPPGQKKVAVKIVPPNGESDPGPFPIPDNAPIEEWPIAFPGVPLEKYQRQSDGDRHVLVVDPGNGLLHEFFYTRKTDSGWQAAIAATFDLKTFKLRPLTWSSADAAGLPIFPAVVKYYECERGMVPHAMRFAVKWTRKEFIFPARHCASNAANPLDPDLPRMGERFRLRANFDVSGFPPHVQAILKGLKKYGMVLADNTGNLGASLSIAPDTRIKGLDALKKIKFKDFEVVQTPGDNKR